MQFPPGQKPPVWTWYVVYCTVMALLYFAVFGYRRRAVGGRHRAGQQ